jgi:hypothetical protein
MLKIAVAVLASVACLTAGTVVNGGFETGNLTGWTSIGTGTGAVGTQGNAVPPAGSYQGLIYSGQGPLSPTDVAVGTLETDLNLAAGAIGTALPNNGSPTYGDAIYQTFSATAGQTLSFTWNFITSEVIPTNYDAALYTLQLNSNTAQATELADTSESGLLTLAVGGSNPFYESTRGGMTGYYTVNIPISVTGNYTLGFIAMQTGDDLVSSGLYVDNVSLSGAGSVPEPSSWLLVGPVGLLFLGRRVAAYGWRLVSRVKV